MRIGRRTIGIFVGDNETIGERGERRHWGDCVKYGFMSGGQGSRTVKEIRKLRPGILIFAYRNQIGYVGLGKVTEKPQPIRKFQVDGKPLLECELQENSALAVNADNEDICEWVVRVEWLKIKTDEEAVDVRPRPIRGHTVCRIGAQEMMNQLQDGFEIPEGFDGSDDLPD